MLSAAETYFPTNAEKGVSEFDEKWYGKALRRMGEPSLLQAASDAKSSIYRFTILPTWGNPISIRITKQAEIYRLAARRLNGQGGYDPGRLTEKKDIKLSDADSKLLEEHISRIHFFDMPTQDGPAGMDGEEWILEGVADGKYHVVVRWCASDYDPKKRKLVEFLTLCSFLSDKSGLSRKPMNKGHELLPTRLVQPCAAANRSAGAGSRGVERGSHARCRLLRSTPQLPRRAPRSLSLGSFAQLHTPSCTTKKHQIRLKRQWLAIGGILVSAD
jgi:hypothetical protein